MSSKLSYLELDHYGNRQKCTLDVFLR